MDMLGIISRSEIMRSKFRKALRLLIYCGFALFLKKGCLHFQEWNLSGGGEKSGFFVFSESPPRGERNGVHWVMGTSSGPSPLPPCTLQGTLPLHFGVMTKTTRLGF